MNAAIVLCPELFGYVWEESQVDVIGKEWGKWRKSTAECIEDFEKGVEGMRGIFNAVLALQPTAIDADVPVGSIINELLMSVGIIQEVLC